MVHDFLWNAVIRSHGYHVFIQMLEDRIVIGRNLFISYPQNYPGGDYNDDVIDGAVFLSKRVLPTKEISYLLQVVLLEVLMTAWMVKSNRFEAAVVVKPVINWISKTLVADNYLWIHANSRYEGQPWENPSTIGLSFYCESGGLPTMVMVVMNDLRTLSNYRRNNFICYAKSCEKWKQFLDEIQKHHMRLRQDTSNLIRKVVTAALGLNHI